MKSGDYRVEIENCIRRVAHRFVRNGGEGAFDLYNESEVQALLFTELRRLPLMKAQTNDKICRHLVHMQWPCLESRKIDIVVWHPNEIDSYRNDWGCSLPQTAPDRRLLAAIQLKHGHGEITSVEKTMKDLEDLGSIDQSCKTPQTLLYFLEFADCYRGGGLGKERYSEVKKALKIWGDKDPKRRKILLLSKDKVGFTFPKGRWAINPLPAGVTESSV